MALRNARQPSGAAVRRLLASTALSLAPVSPAAAQDATWLASPGSGDFNTGANWSAGSVPTGSASFDTSFTTNLTVSSHTTLGGLTFNPGASAYTFANDQALTFNSAGVVINGGSASITNSNAGSLAFNNSSSAGSANITIVANAASPASLTFNGTSTAGNATIVNNSSSTAVVFNGSSTAGNATIANNGFGNLVFQNGTTAGNATITNSGFLIFNGTTTTA